MIKRYLNWAVSVGNWINANGIKPINQGRFDYGMAVSALLVAAPFVIVGVGAFLVPLSPGAQFGILVADVLILLIICVVYIVKRLKQSL